MGDLKTFLTVMKKYGYPNPKVESIAKMTSYDLDELLVDMYAKKGWMFTKNFVKQSLIKLLGEDMEIKMDVSEVAEEGSHVTFKVTPFDFDPEETEDGVYSKIDILDSHMVAPDGSVKTLDEMYEDMDMGEWSDFDELMTSIEGILISYVHQNTGIWLYKE